MNGIPSTPTPAPRPVAARLRHRVSASIPIASGSSGPPLVEPRSEDEVAAVLTTAADEGWRVSPVGRGTWRNGAVGADMEVSTARLTDIVSVDAGDLVATVQAGVDLATLTERLSTHGVWLAVDPPGTRRSVGSVLSTATAGPLRSGFGPVRDHVLGLHMVTFQGRVLRPGGRVVKNVAGFDLGKLALGSFGAFGLITAAHLRLRALPRERRTLTLSGARHDLVSAAHRIVEAGLSPPALELLSPRAAPGGTWTLAALVAGSPAAVEAQTRTIQGAGGRFTSLDPVSATAFWSGLGASSVAHPVTLRTGAMLGALDAGMRLVEDHVGLGWMTATVVGASVRWSGSCSPASLARLRRAAADRGMPVVVERAPEPMLRAAGHTGDYRPGVGALVSRLRATFDPGSLAAVALEAS